MTTSSLILQGKLNERTESAGLLSSTISGFILTSWHILPTTNDTVPFTVALAKVYQDGQMAIRASGEIAETLRSSRVSDLRMGCWEGSKGGRQV